MKRFLVLMMYNNESTLPIIVGRFDDNASAMIYAKLSSDSDPNHKYAVAEISAITK